jgi:hypothetical protein
VSPRPTISHGFPVAEQIAFAPELLQSAVRTDAQPAAVALAVDAPAGVVVAACICCVPAAAPEPA